jgi:23S rRNA (cytidine2498-2'-O)-methyltransferase
MAQVSIPGWLEAGLTPACSCLKKDRIRARILSFLFRPRIPCDILRMTPAPPGPPAPANWLLRIPEIFAPWTADILGLLDAARTTPLGPGFQLVQGANPDKWQGGPAAPFIPWNLPVQHSWPCHPPGMENFVEKAAQTLWKKFGPLQPQAIQLGPLQTGAPDRYYKGLASNLRGRTLQLFPGLSGSAPAESQDPEKPTLFAVVGKEGLFAGMQTPRASNGFHPGGTKFISQGAADTISRAGAKIAEALHYLLLHRPALPAGSHWLELGASPGGMTSELLRRGYRVTALDRAPLDRRLDGHPGLTFTKADVATFTPPPGTLYDALLCDMNGDARHSLRQVIRLTEFMRPGSLIVFTLKTPGSGTFAAIRETLRLTLRDASASGLKSIALTHLTYNRQEFTGFFGI